MFKFDFGATEDSTKQEDVNKEEAKVWAVSKEIKAEDVKEVETIVENCEIKTITTGNLNVKYLLSSDVLVHLIENESSDTVSVLNAEQNHSDLVTAIYEGGLKIWECTYDLLNYISDKKINFSGQKVLDLGCGSGVIGIATFLKGSQSYFQDYNDEIIKFITIPNVVCNIKEFPEKLKISDCKFYAGDWKSFCDLLEIDIIEENDKFDYIFTSETIYNVENYEKLCLVFKKLLKKGGIIFLAAKSYYFGVGGGTSSFQDQLDKANIFTHKSCWKCTEGLNREILEIKLK